MESTFKKIGLIVSIFCLIVLLLLGGMAVLFASYGIGGGIGLVVAPVTYIAFAFYILHRLFQEIY